MQEQNHIPSYLSYNWEGIIQNGVQKQGNWEVVYPAKQTIWKRFLNYFKRN